MPTYTKVEDLAILKVCERLDTGRVVLANIKDWTSLFKALSVCRHFDKLPTRLNGAAGCTECEGRGFADG